MTVCEKNKKVKHEKLTAKKKLRLVCIYLKYLLPALSALLVLILCAVPTFRFSYDETVRQAQSIFGNAATASQTVAGVKITAAAQEAEATLALAKSVGVLTVAVFASAVLMMILSWFLGGMTLAAYAYPPESPTANRIKLWLKFFIPGRWAHFIICFLPILPTLYPHVLKALYERYMAQYMEDGEYKFLEITVRQTWIDPLIAAAVLAVICVIFFILARDAEGLYRMDMFREYYSAEDKNAGAVPDGNVSGRRRKTAKSADDDDDDDGDDDGDDYQNLFS